VGEVKESAAVTCSTQPLRFVDTVASKGIIRLGSQECDATAKYLYMSVPMTQHAYCQVCLTCDTDVV
jgi:hypothetical protein